MFEDWLETQLDNLKDDLEGGYFNEAWGLADTNFFRDYLQSLLKEAYQKGYTDAMGESKDYEC